ncbi:unnamed protein product [Pleuronectes platessa]|uniref:Uncharacterized protein n=1 Tax=Pleuronectes platessa TaxID=8262 RepID=A0A9N7TK63_PLEPL|nr:unnamed protein product [Pleuronectes platessa]
MMMMMETVDEDEGMFRGTVETAVRASVLRLSHFHCEGDCSDTWWQHNEHQLQEPCREKPEWTSGPRTGQWKWNMT